MPSERPAVVLVRPRLPANLGSVARACANFGVKDLRLIEPAAPVDDESHRLASGADAVLEGLDRFDSLPAALTGFDAVVATSSLRGREERRFLTLSELAPFLDGLGEGSRVAFVFGPERSGLTEEERSRASACLKLPTRPEFPTLNLSHAVAVVLAVASLAREKKAETAEPWAPASEVEAADRALGPRPRHDRLLRHRASRALAARVAPDRRRPPALPPRGRDAPGGGEPGAGVAAEEGSRIWDLGSRIQERERPRSQILDPGSES